MTCPNRETLEALVAGELSSAARAAAEAHAQGCAACTARIAWLRRETASVRGWAAADDAEVENLWAGVEARLAPRSSRRRWLVPVVAAGLAAGLAFAVLHVRGEENEETPSAALAVRNAEDEYRGAIATLEQRMTAQGRHAAALGRARTSLARARASAGTDPAARVRLLEGYAAYLKSLRRALQEDEP